MTFKLVDRVRETSISPGTGTAVLAGAALGYQTFSAGVGANNTTYYVIADQSGANWEVGYGTVGAGGTTLARTTVLSSSNAGSLVNFSSGTQDVWVDYTATKAVFQDINGLVTVPTFATSSTTSTTPVLSFNASNTSFASGATVSGSYLQFLLQNKSGTAGASTNYVLSNDLGTDSSYYGEFGMNSSVYSSGTPTDFYSINNGIYFSGHDGDITFGSGNGFKSYFAWGSSGQSAHVINAVGALGFSTNLGTTPALSGTTGYGTAGQVPISAGSTGAVVWSSTPTLTGTNFTGVPISTAISGLGTGVATALAVAVGSAGAFVVNGGALGTPSSGTLTNTTGFPAANLAGTALPAAIVSSSLTSVGTITTGTWSGLFGAVSGANLTNLTAGNLTGTIPSTVLGNSTLYVGTTAIALNRASANLALTGLLSGTFQGSTSGSVQLIPAAVAGTGTVLTMPATTGTIITSGDSATVTNTMLAGSIANAKLLNSSVTFNGVAVALGASGTITATATNALTIGTGLSGTSYNGSAAVTIANTGVLSVTGTAPVVSSGGQNPAISMAAATTSVSGYLTSADWNTFNGKQTALISGTNIKTVGGTSLLGTGDLGTIGVAYGGTGLTSTPANGAIDIGNGSGFTRATITAGSGLTVTNGTGSITIGLTQYTITSLVVSGGASGGERVGGGGGGGGVLTGSSTVSVGTTLTIVVGAGGAAVGNAGATGVQGASGSASSFSLGTISPGGGGGAYSGVAALSGGCGGGGPGFNTNTGGSGTAGQGFAGGTGVSGGTGTGGGGGAGAVGGNGSGSTGGAGGAGFSSSITGTAVNYAGGGGGGSDSAGAGGAGGGGAGASGTANATAGTVNTGGGGGGARNSADAGGVYSGAGGSGVVILSIPSSNYTGIVTGSPTVTTSGGNTIVTFTASGSYRT